MDCSPPGSSVHEDSPSKNTGLGCHALLQKNLPNPGIRPRSPASQADSLPAEPPGKPENTGVGSLCLLQQIFPNPGIKPGSPALQADSLPTELSGMGGRYKREGIHVYLWLIHGEVSQTTTKVCKAIILQSKNKLNEKEKCKPWNSWVSCHSQTTVRWGLRMDTFNWKAR